MNQPAKKPPEKTREKTNITNLIPGEGDDNHIFYVQLTFSPRDFFFP